MAVDQKLFPEVIERIDALNNYAAVMAPKMENSEHICSVSSTLVI